MRPAKQTVHPKSRVPAVRGLAFIPSPDRVQPRLRAGRGAAGGRLAPRESGPGKCGAATEPPATLPRQAPAQPHLRSFRTRAGLASVPETVASTLTACCQLGNKCGNMTSFGEEGHHCAFQIQTPRPFFSQNLQNHLSMPVFCSTSKMLP